MLWKFFKLTGKHQSMIILCDDIFDNSNPVPPMNPVDICVFMKYKRGMKNETLFTEEIINGTRTKKVVKDIKGNTIKCDGGWIKSCNEDQFLSAVSTCHQVRGNGLIYRIECSVCLKKKLKTSTVPCPTHTNNDRWYDIGNPITSDVMKNYMMIVDELTSHEEIKKANSFYPIDFYNFGIHLIESNDPKKFMLWVIIVMGKIGFLRENEINISKVNDLVTASSPK